MKKAFYIHWVVFGILTILEIIGINLTFEQSKIALALYWINFASVAFYPMYNIYVYQERISDLDQHYLHGCMVSFGLRTLLFIMGIWGWNDKVYILTLCGFVMLIYFIFDIGRKLDKL